MNSKYSFLILALLLISCNDSTQKAVKSKEEIKPFTWSNATVYFLMTDRFNNANPANDFVHPTEPAPYRGFMGGDIKGVTEKIKSGYFDSLGVTALWTTPVLENIKGSVDEGTGLSYPFHGYWTRDWTAFDERIGSKEDYREMVDEAHKHGIRVLMDVIVNHTGPVTPLDSQWPDEWVKTGPQCNYADSESTINCTLVANLPDIKTESMEEVSLPAFLIEKWKSEGRYEQEVAELDAFFEKTQYPRRPYYYIIKWLVDYITEFGLDGYRVDTTKHTEKEVWADLKKEAVRAYELLKKEHPERVLDKDADFYMLGEVYNYYVSGGREYDYGDKKVDFYANGYDALINFDFKGDATKSYEEIFSKYDEVLSGPLKGRTVLNYISSHDDGSPFDKDRIRTKESATKLLLTQGGAQIYYGDESARSLSVEAEGDAVLRSFMNWEDHNNPEIKELMSHWGKLGRFRSNHIAIGSGSHQKIADQPYTFQRTNKEDKVVIALDAPIGKKAISVGPVFEDGVTVKDYYSGTRVTVASGKVDLDTPYDVVLLEESK